MSEHDADGPRFCSKQWWTQTNPYWGEWRSGPWGWFYLVAGVALLAGGVYFFNNTREGWITIVVLVTVICASTVTARPGRRRDVARLRRHQYKCRNYLTDEG